MNNADLTTATVKQLWDIFRDGMAASAAGLMSAALAWRELERRGADLTRCRTPLTNRLSAVADGKLSAAALLRYGHAPVLDSFIGMDLDEQAKMATADYRIPVVKEDGAAIMLRPDDLTVAQVKRVFAGGKVNTVAEQQRAMPKPAATPAKPAPARTSQVILKPSVVEAPEPTAFGDAAGFAWLGLTKIQSGHLSAAARRHGMSPASFVLSLLQEAGAIEGISSKRKAA